MHLQPKDQEKLLVVVAADLARRRQARGLKLNYPEAIAIITYELLEGARDGRTVADLMNWGSTILTREDVMEGVPEMIPGEYILAKDPVICNEGREAIALEVLNRGDRPVQVGSHFHFAEANRALEFDRQAALGRRLDIPAGTAVRLEPGDKTTVNLIPLGGDRIVYGFRDLVDGPLDPHKATDFTEEPGDYKRPRRSSVGGDAPQPLNEREGYSNETND